MDGEIKILQNLKNLRVFPKGLTSEVVNKLR